jgi:hypothetical protein
MTVQRLLFAAIGASLLMAGWFVEHIAAGTSESNLGKAVLVELFTSEGCSSCPPADQLLTRLVKEQPVNGVQIIAMSEHVDYWNRLGWSDPFSSAQFSGRQNEYARALGRTDVYTPQMIVDGQNEFIGSNGTHAVQAVSSAAQKAKSSILIAPIMNGTQAFKLHVQIDRAVGINERDSADIYLALTEDNLVSRVSRGENAGRQLSHHVAVVRRLDRIGRLDSLNGFSSDTVVPLSPTWKSADLRVVVFAQSHKTRSVVAVATAPIMVAKSD